MIHVFIAHWLYHCQHCPTEYEGLTCLDIILQTDNYHSSWDFGPCTPSHTNANIYSDTIYIFTEKCCVTSGDYLLSCKNTKKDGWTNSFVKIGGHKFCDDYTGYNTFRALNIPGMHLYIIISLRSAFLLYVQ